MKELARRELARRQQPKQDQGPGQLEALGRGIAQGVSFGFADEASAAVGAGIKGLQDTVGNFISGKLEFGDFVGEYQQQVEAARQADAAAAEAFPKTFTGGEIAGAIGSAVIPGGLGAKAVQAAGKGLGGAIKVGAGLGGLGAAGKSEADLTQGEVGELAEDVLLGGAIGAATGFAGEGIAKGLGAVGNKIIPQKVKDIAADVIKPKAVAAELRTAAKANTKKAFDQRTAKNLEKGIEGLQKRGVISGSRKEYLGTDKRELFKTVQEEANTLGSSIEKVVNQVDDAGVDFGSNSLGIGKLREAAKQIKKSSTSDEFNTMVDQVQERLQGDTFKASDLFGLRKELDRLLEVGGKAGALRKSQKATLAKVRTQIKDALQEKVDDVAAKNPAIQAELDSHGFKKFGELNDAFGDTAVVRDTIADAAAIADFEEGAALASPLGQEVKDLLGKEGALSAIISGAARVGGAVAEPTIRAAGAVGKTVRAAAQAEKQSAVIARQLYQSIDEDNVINDEAERKAHAGRVMSNPTMSHAQKFREINMLQNTGKINPDSIPARDKRSILKEIEAQNRALEEEILRGL
jgi:predicted  nucleic acid-binding Zn-ribbon protein